MYVLSSSVDGFIGVRCEVCIIVGAGLGIVLLAIESYSPILNAQNNFPLKINTSFYNTL